MRYHNLETDFNEVSTLGNFILERLPAPMTLAGESAEARDLMELAARLALLTCKLHQKQEYSDTLTTAKTVIEVVGAIFILHFQLKSQRHRLSEITSDPQIIHFLRWIKSGASHHGNGVESHPMIDKAVDYLDEWLGGIRWQYDAIVELCSELSKRPTPVIPLTMREEVSLPAEYAMRLISKILVNFLTIGIVLYDEMIEIVRKSNRQPVRVRVRQLQKNFLQNNMRLVHAI